MGTTYGSANFASAGNVTLAGISPSSDPVRGQSWAYLYTGTRSGIESLAANLALQGVRYTSRHERGLSSLEAYFGADPDGGTESPVDSYSRDVDIITDDIFANPLLWPWLYSSSNPAEARLLMLDTVEGGLPASFSNDAANDAYLSLTRGKNTYSYRPPTLRRTRTFSVSYATRRIPSTIPVAYTRAALIREFSIPDAIASAMIPEDPTTPLPERTQWLWMLTQDSSETSRGGLRITETMVWAADALYPGLNNVIT